MKLIITIPVTAVQSLTTKHLIYDGGTLKVSAGEWLVYGNGFGPLAVKHLDDIDAEPLDLPEDSAEALLRLALDKGYF